MGDARLGKPLKTEPGVAGYVVIRRMEESVQCLA